MHRLIGSGYRHQYCDRSGSGGWDLSLVLAGAADLVIGGHFANTDVDRFLVYHVESRDQGY